MTLVIQRNVIPLASLSTGNCDPSVPRKARNLQICRRNSVPLERIGAANIPVAEREDGAAQRQRQKLVIPWSVR